MTTEILERFYDLNGVSLAIEGDQQQIGFLDPILGLLACADRKLNDWVIRLVTVNEVDPPPLRSRTIWEGPLPENLESVCSEYDNNRTLFVPRHYSMTIETSSMRPTKRKTAATTMPIMPFSPPLGPNVWTMKPHTPISLMVM